jgi:hypothetical protein
MPKWDFRNTPESGLKSDIAGGPVRARSGLVQRGKKKRHSFTCLNNGNAQRRQPHRWRLSTREQRWRHGEAERLRSLEIDRKLELGRLFDRDVGCKNAWCILKCWLLIKALEEKCRR